MSREMAESGSPWDFWKSACGQQKQMDWKLLWEEPGVGSHLRARTRPLASLCHALALWRWHVLSSPWALVFLSV